MSTPDEETTWLVKNWVWVGAVGGVLLFLVAIGVLLWLGLLDVLIQSRETGIAPWSVFVVVSLIVIVLIIWGRKWF